MISSQADRIAAEKAEAERLLKEQAEAEAKKSDEADRLAAEAAKAKASSDEAAKEAEEKAEEAEEAVERETEGEGVLPTARNIGLGAVEQSDAVHKSNCRGTSNHDLHAIDATPARRRGVVSHRFICAQARRRPALRTASRAVAATGTHVSLRGR